MRKKERFIMLVMTMMSEEVILRTYINVLGIISKLNDQIEKIINFYFIFIFFE